MNKKNKRAMIKLESIYMWDSMDKTIQKIDSQIDLISKTTGLYDPQYCSKKMKIVPSNLLILLENLCQWKNHMILCMGLNPDANSLMKDSLSWKVVSNQDRIISRGNFHNLAMNLYLHQKNHLDILPYYVSNETEVFLWLLS